MNQPIVIGLILLGVLALAATVWLIRSVARDIQSMDEDEDVLKELERWRDGK